jgi:hypothetical protein
LPLDNRIKVLNRHIRLISALIVLVLQAASCLQGQGAEVRVRRTFGHDRDLETSFVWQNFPRWDGEKLVGYLGNLSSGPILYNIDRDGRRDETLFTLKDGAQINIFDIAGFSDDQIAIVGSALTADRKGTTFLARIAADRKQQILTRTWPYCPHLVTFAADGTIWTIGNLKDDEATRDIAMYVLRRFDASGRMLGSSTIQLGEGRPAEAALLRASQDRVGWFTGKEYIEFSLNGSEMSRYNAAEAANPRDITGVALSQENDVVAGRFGKEKAEFLVLDRENRTWTPASVPKEHAPAWAWVLGFDKTTLVTTTANGRLRRFKTPEAQQ